MVVQIRILRGLASFCGRSEDEKGEEFEMGPNAEGRTFDGSE